MIRPVIASLARTSSKSWIRQALSALVVLLALFTHAGTALARPATPPVDQTLVDNPGSPSQDFGQVIAGNRHLMVAGGAEERQHFVWTPAGWSFVAQEASGAIDLAMRGEHYSYRNPNGTVQRRKFNGTSVVHGNFSVGFATARAVAIGPNRLAIGFPESGTGFVNVYHAPDGISLQLEDSIQGSTHGERFGDSLDFDETGTVLWIGAPGDGTGLTGRTERRQWDGADWVASGELKAPGEQPDNFFGGATAVDGPRLIVGAPGHDVTQPVLRADAGAAYLYQNRAAAAVELEGSFAGESAGDRLGAAVDILDATAIAGAPSTDLPSSTDSASSGGPSLLPDGTIADAGEAQLYWRVGPATWSYVASLRRPPAASDEAGTEVALVGRTALVGVPGLDGTSVNASRGGVLSFLGTNSIFLDGFESGSTDEWSSSTL